MKRLIISLAILICTSGAFAESVYYISSYGDGLVKLDGSQAVLLDKPSGSHFLSISSYPGNKLLVSNYASSMPDLYYYDYDGNLLQSIEVGKHYVKDAALASNGNIYMAGFAGGYTNGQPNGGLMMYDGSTLTIPAFTASQLYATAVTSSNLIYVADYSYRNLFSYNISTGSIVTLRSSMSWSIGWMDLGANDTLYFNGPNRQVVQRLNGTSYYNWFSMSGVDILSLDYNDVDGYYYLLAKSLSDSTFDIFQLTDVNGYGQLVSAAPVVEDIQGLTHGSTFAGDWDMKIIDVPASVSIPEPSSMALLGAALCAVVRRFRSR
ncbi:MAG: PEP-CTERM sorting domain-containing protein [Candidatus Auribacterota bacterium]